MKPYTQVPLKQPCPDCGAPMFYEEREDEFGTNELHPYSVNSCTKCGYQISDNTDEISYPDD